MNRSAMLAIAFFCFTCAFAQQNQENPTTGVFQSDLFLNGKTVYRNYPKDDMSYKDWDINATLISSYVGEDSGILYEEKIRDSIVFRRGTNEVNNSVRFWWFRLLSPKDSIYFKSKDITIRVGSPVEIIQKNFPDMWLLYQKEMEDERKREREIQLYTDLWFRFYEDSKDYACGAFMMYVQDGIIARIVINFMTEGDMP